MRLVSGLPGNMEWLYLVSDFKKRNGYKRSTELSKIYGLYRQDYCGCIYSKNQREREKKLPGGRGKFCEKLRGNFTESDILWYTKAQNYVEEKRESYGTVMGRTFYERKPTNWFIISMRPFHLINDFMSRISRAARRML